MRPRAALFQGSARPVKHVRDSDIVARQDPPVADFYADRAFPEIEPPQEIIAELSCAPVSKRGYYVEIDNIRGIQ
jgi:hypothetical protein